MRPSLTLCVLLAACGASSGVPPESTVGRWVVQIGLPTQEIAAADLEMRAPVEVEPGQLWVTLGQVAYPLGSKPDAPDTLVLRSPLHLSDAFEHSVRAGRMEDFAHPRTGNASSHYGVDLGLAVSPELQPHFDGPLGERGHTRTHLAVDVREPTRCGPAVAHEVHLVSYGCPLDAGCAERERRSLSRMDDGLFRFGPYQIWVKVEAAECVVAESGPP